MYMLRGDYSTLSLPFVHAPAPAVNDSPARGSTDIHANTHQNKKLLRNTRNKTTQSQTQTQTQNVLLLSHKKERRYSEGDQFAYAATMRQQEADEAAAERAKALQCTAATAIMHVPGGSYAGDTMLVAYADGSLKWFKPYHHLHYGHGEGGSSASKSSSSKSSHQLSKSLKASMGGKQNNPHHGKEWHVSRGNKTKSKNKNKSLVNDMLGMTYPSEKQNLQLSWKVKRACNVSTLAEEFDADVDAERRRLKLGNERENKIMMFKVGLYFVSQKFLLYPLFSILHSPSSLTFNRKFQINMYNTRNGSNTPDTCELGESLWGDTSPLPLDGDGDGTIDPSKPDSNLNRNDKEKEVKNKKKETTATMSKKNKNRYTGRDKEKLLRHNHHSHRHKAKEREQICENSSSDDNNDGDDMDDVPAVSGRYSDERIIRQQREKQRQVQAQEEEKDVGVDTNMNSPSPGKAVQTTTPIDASVSDKYLEKVATAAKAKTMAMSMAMPIPKGRGKCSFVGLGLGRTAAMAMEVMPPMHLRSQLQSQSQSRSLDDKGSSNMASMASFTCNVPLGSGFRPPSNAHAHTNSNMMMTTPTKTPHTHSNRHASPGGVMPMPADTANTHSDKGESDTGTSSDSSPVHVGSWSGIGILSGSSPLRRHLDARAAARKTGQEVGVLSLPEATSLTHSMSHSMMVGLDGERRSAGKTGHGMKNVSGSNSGKKKSKAKLKREEKKRQKEMKKLARRKKSQSSHHHKSQSHSRSPLINGESNSTNRQMPSPVMQPQLSFQASPLPPRPPLVASLSAPPTLQLEEAAVTVAVSLSNTMSLSMEDREREGEREISDNHSNETTEIKKEKEKKKKKKKKKCKPGSRAWIREREKQKEEEERERRMQQDLKRTLNDSSSSHNANVSPNVLASTAAAGGSQSPYNSPYNSPYSSPRASPRISPVNGVNGLMPLTLSPSVSDASDSDSSMNSFSESCSSMNGSTSDGSSYSDMSVSGRLSNDEQDEDLWRTARLASIRAPLTFFQNPSNSLSSDIQLNVPVNANTFSPANLGVSVSGVVNGMATTGHVLPGKSWVQFESERSECMDEETAEYTRKGKESGRATKMLTAFTDGGAALVDLREGV